MVRIGVLAFRGEEEAVARWSQVAEYLTAQIPDHRFVLCPVDLQGMGEAAARATVDFVLTNPGNYVLLEAEHGAARVATLESIWRGQAYTQYGAVIFSRAASETVKEIEDLAGRRMAAVDPAAFGGYQMAWQELLRHGLDPEQDLAEVRFMGFPQDDIVRAVLAGEVDAGTVRTDVLERMALEGKLRLSRVRVLDRRREAGFPFLLSTGLYPEWPFAKLRDTPDDLAQTVAVALLQMPEQPHGRNPENTMTWTIPLDYSPVHGLLQDLGVPPYRPPGPPSLAQVVARYWYWLAVAAAALLALTSFATYVTRTNRRMAASEQTLREEVQERRHAEEALRRHRETLETRVQQRTAELQRVNRALEDDIVARRRAEEALRHSAQTLRRLHDIASAPSVELPVKLRQLLQTGCEHFAAATGLLVRATDQQACVVYAAGDTAGLEEGRCLPQGWDTCALLPGAGTPLAITRAQGSSLRDCLTRFGWQSYLATRVERAGGPYGMLVFASPRARDQDFSRLDLDILQLMGHWIARELDRQQAQEQAQQHLVQLAHVSRLSTMGEMASGLAHELNQPLTAITNYARGGARRLRAGAADPASLAEAMERAASEAERAAEIIRRMRDLARRGYTEARPVDLNQAAGRITRFLTSEARRLHVTVHVELAADLPEVRADPIQIEQVILNLLRNALEAAAETRNALPAVEVATWQEGDRVALAVTDNGPGLAGQDPEAVFSPFYTTKAEGMGIGLSISRTIVESHGGELVAEPAPEGGARFRFHLPAAEAA